MAPRRGSCRLFASARGCHYGDKCRFSHNLTQEAETSARRAPQSPASRRRNRSHRDWLTSVRQCERKDLNNFELRDIFQTAKDSLDSAVVEVQHEVIKALADQQGLKLIRQVTELEANDLDPLVLPFLETLSHSATASSLLLEVHVGTIYNVLYGQNGSKGIQLFETIITLYVKRKNQTGYGDTGQRLLAHALDTFSRMLTINQGAAVSNDIKGLAQQLEAHINGEFGDDQPRMMGSMNLDRIVQDIRTRLGLAEKITDFTGMVKAVTRKLARFKIQCDGPGKLSATGARHDNDHEEIENICILPTAEEIWSPRSEYLPTKDPNTHHVPGVRSLLDRQFRLLREDTVGQLREAARQAGVKARQDAPMTDLARQGGQIQLMRTNSFSDAVITTSFFDQRHGLLHLVEFNQPRRMHGLSKKALKRAWTDSRDLAVDSCICMLGPLQQATFFSVVDRIPSSSSLDDNVFTGPDLDRSQLGKLIQSLNYDNKRAAIIIKALNVDDKSVNEILSRQQTRSKAGIAHILLEFPGMLLASFVPTLEALQEMSKNRALPFSSLLAPDLDGKPFGPLRAPEYSRGPAFEFDLSQVANGKNVHFSSRRPFDLENFSRTSGMDSSQTLSFIDALRHEFALIQGPPGTGKSYVGVKLIRTLLQNRVAGRLGPILVVCYTNHALDQILEHLVENKVEQIVRIGGRSKSEALANVNLQKLRRDTLRTKTQKHTAWQSHSDIESIVDEAKEIMSTISRPDSMKAIKEHLFWHEPEFYDLFFQKDPDEEGWQTVNHHADKVIDQWLAGGPRGPARFKKHDLHAGNANNMTNGERRGLHNGWVQKISEKAIASCQGLVRQFRDAKRDLDLVHKETSFQCLKDAHIIGVTTTGLAKNVDVLRKLLAKVLIVEEAGEIMEAHMLPALLPSLEHVIAIGDHQQLRPQIANFDLSVENSRGAQYALDVSLFERLIHPEPGLPSLPFSTLQTQRRMHPSISRLIRETLYPKLVDDPSVSEYPEIESMPRRLYWLDHKNLEDTESEMSKSNMFEVEMVAALVTHLIKQGTYKISQIVVLTPYLAQLRKLRHRFAKTFEIVVGDRDAAELEAAGIEGLEALQNAQRASFATGLRISTVDNYQGEESDIVIVSFVRSNEAGKVGFLKTTNRINVLLSRARHGMYIIGNASVAQNAPMWNDVIEILESEGAIGPSLPLVCPRHPETSIEISTPDDFSRFAPEGGCQLICPKRLKCGHSCVNKCHAQHLHDAVICHNSCPRLRNTCSHPCRKICGLPCDAKCQAQIQNIRLPCNHVAKYLKCYESQNPDTVKCKELVQKKVPGCEHTVQVYCHQDVASEAFRCGAPCSRILECGHDCASQCCNCRIMGEDGAVAMQHPKCSKICDRGFSNCAHNCKELCHEPAPCGLCNQPCSVQCAHSKCNKKCHEPCAPCAETCAWSCEHQGKCTLPCSIPCNRLPCSERCPKMLECGHQCPSICGETCPESRFCQICGDENVLNEVVDMLEFAQYRDIDLTEERVIVPPCGHLQTVSSLDGTMSMRDFYIHDSDDKITGLAGASKPFEVSDIKPCSTCRQPLRSINRYSRIVKRGLIDEGTKRFIVWSNSRFQVLEKQGHNLDKALASSIETARFNTNLGGRHDPLEAVTLSPVQVRGKNLGRTIQALKQTGGRYNNIWTHRMALAKFCQKVATEEQPFRKVWDLCRSSSATQASKVDLSSFESAADSALNTRSHMLATGLLLHTEAGMLADLVEIWMRSRLTNSTLSALIVDTTEARKACIALYTDALERDQPMQQVQALIYYGFFAAAEGRCPANTKTADQVRKDALENLAQADAVVATNASTALLSPQIQKARTALTGEFQSVVTDDEMRQVYAAMATEFRGTGHWYRCVNGHAFTVGECGMPMQLARCPQCGAAVGGQHHQATAGVTVASDIERRFGRGI